MSPSSGERRPGPAARILSLARAAAMATGAVAASPAVMAGQAPDLRGYYLHAAAGIRRSAFIEGGVLDVQRLRLMTRPAWGPLALDLSYEHTLTLRTGSLALGYGFEGGRQGAQWLDLQGTLAEGRHARWAHGLDRLSLSLKAGRAAAIEVGRQTVSWATTLFFTPADPFVPFDPADPFREFRAGVDAARVQIFLGPLSDLDAVVRVAPESEGGETVTALLRGRGVLAGWELSVWAGALHDAPAAAVAAAGSAGALGLRAEGAVRRMDGRTVGRVAVGADRRWQVAGRDLHLVLEYQHDGLGAARPQDLLVTAASPAAARGELQVLGQDAVAASVSYQVHPLTALSLLGLVNARDGSVLLAPGLSRSLSNEASLRLGLFAGLGREADAVGPALRSEYGATPFVAYLAASVFF